MRQQDFQWLSFGLDQSYEDVYAWQKALVEQRIRHEIPDTLLLGEHPPVITLGRGSHEQHLLDTSGISVVAIERGGDVTYHGPGQLVGYPIFYLATDEERDLHRYLRNLEEVIIRVLAHFDIHGCRNPGWTGVWVEHQKIASIGVAVRKWVTYHGFALNVIPQMEAFQRINPCGLSADTMTAMALWTEVSPLTLQAVQDKVLYEMATVFDKDLQ
jgi:lipoate-protein ligase B